MSTPHSVNYLLFLNYSVVKKIRIILSKWWHLSQKRLCSTDIIFSMFTECQDCSEFSCSALQHSCGRPGRSDECPHFTSEQSKVPEGKVVQSHTWRGLRSPQSNFWGCARPCVRVTHIFGPHHSRRCRCYRVCLWFLPPTSCFVGKLWLSEVSSAETEAASCAPLTSRPCPVTVPHPLTLHPGY